MVHMVDKLGLWHRLPVLMGLGYLGLRRHLHHTYNLLHVGTLTGTRYDVKQYPHRTPDGKCNHPTDDIIGSQGTFFGRNMPPSTSNFGLLEPHPSVVATKLLERRKFVDCGKQFNMIACSWLQFMIHDWIDHMEDTQQVEMVAPVEVAHQCPLKSFKFYRSKQIPTGSLQTKTGCLNSRTPWWDGSVIYGNNEAGLGKVRSYNDGKLKISSDGLLEHDEKGIPISGDVRNYWAGFSLLQALFVREHNAICDMLKEHYPEFDDEKLYQHARLVTSAIIAKIHTIDWTVELLKTDTLLAAMRLNWYGMLGKKVKNLFGNIFGPELSGLVGLKEPQDHGVPYSLTEEFVSVYRMHTTLPDTILIRDIESKHKTTPQIQQEVNMMHMIGKEGEKRLSKIGMEKMLVSMGHQACGAVTLRNYPLWMRNLVAHDIHGEDRADPVDMASMEIYRDRERKVPRYNEFRRNMLMIPISKWEDLTDDQEIVEALNQVYGDDVEKLDLLVGIHAEKKIKGFAICETAFFIFVLIASRRLEADRFFTSNFNSQTYTKKGLEWINKIESLKDIIDRHFPEMTKTWMRCSSAFSVWDSDPNAPNYVPLYFRFSNLGS
ncbi:hypothetical protein R6Q59_020769 [Mikania micrantha]